MKQIKYLYAGPKEQNCLKKEMDNWKFDKKKKYPISLTGVETFVQKLNDCFKEALIFCSQAEYQINPLFDRICWILHEDEIEIENLISCVRALAFVTKYYQLDKFVNKHFYCEIKECAQMKYDEIVENGIVFTFVQYYRKCLVCSHLKKLLEQTDLRFSVQKQMYLKEGINLIPIVSLFKLHTDLSLIKCQTKQHNRPWLMVVFQFLKGINEELGKKLKKEFLLLNEMRDAHYFFCTKVIYELDNLGYINCFTGDYNFLILIIYMILFLLGNTTLISRFLKQCNQDCGILYDAFKTAKLGMHVFPECHELISLKPLKEQDYKITPTSFMIAASPILYNYDIRNFPQSGILTQLFLYAAGVPLKHVCKSNNAIIVQANDILSYVPPEWKNLISIKTTNFEYFNQKRQEADFANVAPLTYNEEDEEIYFSILPNDVYVALHYISRVLSYYMKKMKFLKDSQLFDIYENILEDVLTKRKPSDNSLMLAQKIIWKMDRYLKCREEISNFYDTPTTGKESFDFFSTNQLKFIKLYKQRSSQCPYAVLEEQTDSAINLILYLSTILQVENSINLNPFLQLDITDVHISFLDKEYFLKFLYIQGQNDPSLHCLLNQKDFSLGHFGLGLCKMMCTVKNPVNRVDFLKKLVHALHARIPHDNEKQLKILLPNITNTIFFLFKRHNILQWFYPIVLSTSLAYGGISFFNNMKKCITSTHNCEQDLLSPLNKQELLDKHCKIVLLNNKISLQNVEQKVIIDKFQQLFEEIYPKLEDLELRKCDLFYFDLLLNIN